VSSSAQLHFVVQLYFLARFVFDHVFDGSRVHIGAERGSRVKDYPLTVLVDDLAVDLGHCSALLSNYDIVGTATTYAKGRFK
jgi:hypothetical protein